jgi:cytochrome P450
VCSTKPPDYQTTLPLGTTGSLGLLTDPAEHAPRRKLWERAFTPTALRAYEPLIHKRITQLCEILQSHAGESVDLGDWMGRATFDMMGDFGYGGAFELMADGDPGGFVRIVGDGFAALDVWGTVPWVRPLLKLLPADNAKIVFKTALEVAERRQAAGSKIHDLFFYFVRATRLIAQ